MKKILFFALALVAGVLAFTSCNNNDPKHPLQNIKFVCDYPQRGDLFWQESMYFGTGEAFEYAFVAYSDEAHTKAVSGDGATGTYEIQDEYIDLHYKKGYLYEGSSKKEISAYQPRDERVYYTLKDDVLTLTFNKGELTEYSQVYYKQK